MKKNRFLFLLGLALYGCTAYSSEPKNSGADPLIPMNVQVKMPYEVTLGDSRVSLDLYLCWVVASELPVISWYQQFQDKPEMLAKLKRYVSVFAVAARSYALRVHIQEGVLKSSQSHQMAKKKHWSDCSLALQKLISEGISETHGWVLVDPVISQDYSSIAQSCYARTSVAPSPNGAGMGPYQGSHFDVPSPANPVEPGHESSFARMGLSQLGLAAIVFGYPVGFATGSPVDFTRPLGAYRQTLSVDRYLAHYYPNYALAAPGLGIYRLWDIYGELHGNPAIAKLPIRELSQGGGEYVARSGEVVPSNWTFYHKGHDGKLLPALGPEVGFYVDLSPGRYRLSVESHKENGYTAPLRAYLYGESLVGYTKVSRGGTQTAVLEIQQAGRYIVAVDVAHFEPIVARQREYGGTMPPFWVSLTRK